MVSAAKKGSSKSEATARGHWAYGPSAGDVRSRLKAGWTPERRAAQAERCRSLRPYRFMKASGGGRGGDAEHMRMMRSKAGNSTGWGLRRILRERGVEAQA